MTPPQYYFSEQVPFSFLLEANTFASSQFVTFYAKMVLLFLWRSCLLFLANWVSQRAQAASSHLGFLGVELLSHRFVKLQTFVPHLRSLLFSVAFLAPQFQEFLRLCLWSSLWVLSEAFFYQLFTTPRLLDSFYRWALKTSGHYLYHFQRCHKGRKCLLNYHFFYFR